MGPMAPSRAPPLPAPRSLFADGQAYCLHIPMQERI